MFVYDEFGNEVKCDASQVESMLAAGFSSTLVAEVVEVVDFSKMSKADMEKYAEEKGIEVPEDSRSVPDMRAFLKAQGVN